MEMATQDISKITIAVEIAGQAYFVLLQDVDTNFLCTVLANIMPEKTMRLAKAPDGYKFYTIAEAQKR